MHVLHVYNYTWPIQAMLLQPHTLLLPLLLRCATAAPCMGGWVALADSSTLCECADDGVALCTYLRDTIRSRLKYDLFNSIIQHLLLFILSRATCQTPPAAIRSTVLYVVTFFLNAGLEPTAYVAL